MNWWLVGRAFAVGCGGMGAHRGGKRGYCCEVDWGKWERGLEVEMLKG